MLSKTTKTALCLSTALAALAAPAVSPAAVRLVDDDAQANFGTCETTACASIPYAVGQAQSGDTIRIAAGNYTVAGLITAKTLHFEGAGSGATKVASTIGTPLTVTGGGSVKDLELQGGVDSGVGRSGLRVTGDGTLGNDEVDLARLVVRSGAGYDPKGSSTKAALAVAATNDANGSLWVEGDDLDVQGAVDPSSNGAGVEARGERLGLILRGSEVTGPKAAYVNGAVLYLMRSKATVDPQRNEGVIVDGGELQVWHSRITGPTAIDVRGGANAAAAWVHDSLVTANDPLGGTAIHAKGGAEVANVTVRRSTLAAATTVGDSPMALRVAHVPGSAPVTGRLDSALVQPGLGLVAQGTGARFEAERSWMPEPVTLDGAQAPAAGSGAFRSGDPKVDADLRPLPGSPLIDGGMSLGGIETDLDGNSRSNDGDGDGVRTPDIGAFEAAHVPGVVPAGTSTGAGAAAVAPATDPAPKAVAPAADRVAPALRSARLLKPVFATRRGKGTRLRFTLSEAGRVGVRVDRLVRTHGKTRVRPAGTEVLPGRAGVNDITFTGRVGGKKLRPGRYRLTLTATDAAGNRSAPVKLSFRVKR